MPLIFNDENSRWVSDEEPYNCFEYFVVRKLYVKMKPTPTPLTPMKIMKIFKRYGPVDTVQVQRDYAYIQFSNAKDACIALTLQPAEQNPMFTDIQPAFTWKQPSAMHQSINDTSSNSTESSLLMLNDDCLLKIFEFCDFNTRLQLWNVCWKTRNLLEQFVLRKNDQYSIDFQLGRPVKSLKRVHDELKCIGPFVKKLCLTDPSYPLEPYIYEPFLLQCKKYVGASINELRMNFGIFTGRNLELIEPLLLRAESLHIRFEGDDDWNEPLSIHAPKLKSLSTEIDLQYYIGYNIANNLLNNTFPQLEKLVLRATPTSKALQSFLQNHAKLKYLQLLTLDAHAVATIVARELPNLEELVFYIAFFEEAEVFWPLENCKNLKKIVLHNCESHVMDENAVLSIIYTNLRKLKALRSIMVTASTSRSEFLDQSILLANLGRDIPHLEHFCTDFQLNQSTIIEFIRNARHLKTFCVALYEIVCPMNIDFIKTLVGVRKSRFENDSNQIFVLNLEFYPPKDQTAHQNIELDAEMAKYVTVSFRKWSAEQYFDPELLTQGSIFDF